MKREPMTRWPVVWAKPVSPVADRDGGIISTSGPVFEGLADVTVPSVSSITA